MSENKFIAKLKGEPTPKSVVEIQNDRLVAPFKSSPMGHIADRDSSVVVAKGAQNWAVNQGQLVPVADDYIGTESDLTATSRVSGAGLWLNATYTFPATGDETNPVSAIIAPSAKWVLTLCGDSLITQNGSVITLTMLVKIGATHLTTKQFKVRECASQFSQRLAIDFSESEQKVIKAHGGSPLTVQVLCDDEGASATIYSGMTHLTLLQRKIDAELVSTDNVLLPEFIENLLEGYIIPADYFSRYDYIEQVEDGGSAFPQFTRSGDDMNFSGWLDISSIKNDLDELGDQVSGIEEKIPGNASASNQLATKAEIATKQDQLTAGDNIIISNNVISATGAGGGAGFDIVVVQELPATGQKGIVYLLAKDGTAPDVYDEYVWITATQTFELIGTTQVDLSDYVKNTDYATDAKAGIIRSSEDLATNVNTYGYLRASFQTLEQYNSASDSSFIGKRTLENIKEDLVARAIENAVNTRNLTVGSGEGALYIGDVAGTATIATNNGLDIVAQTKFDTAPTTDDTTAWADVNSTALVTKQQVATALSTAGGDSLPDQTGNAGKFLITDGATASWGASYATTSQDSLGNVYYRINIGTVDGHTGNATSSSCVAIGTDKCGDNCIGILGKAYYTGSVAIGHGSVADSFNGTAIGNNAKVYGSLTNKGGIAIGYGASVSYAKCAIQLGGNGGFAGYTNSDENTFKVGNANGNFEMMSANGTIPAERMSATAGATGQVLTKTDTGMAWQDASGGDGDIDCGVMS